jgi:hypothetical protein
VNIHVAMLIGLANCCLPTLSADGDYFPEELEVTALWYHTAIMAWRELSQTVM